MKRTHTITFLILVAAITGTRAQAEKVQWTQAEGGNGHLYEAVLENGDWDAAIAGATARGGHLATVTSEAENNFIYSLVLDLAYWQEHSGPWLGGYQPPGSPEPAGGWTWVTGETWTYSHWWPSQPDNAGGWEHYLQLHGGPLYGGPYWNDIRRDRSLLGYVVEYDYVVCPDGSGSYSTIQDAIDAAVPGSIVFLCDGIFTGSGNRDVAFLGKAITVRSLSGDPTACVIDCQGTPENWHRGFAFVAGEGPASILEGVTIRNGYLDPQDGSGGAILCEAASPTIRNCVFRENYAAYGGAVCLHYSSASVIDCLMIDNEANYRGGALMGQYDCYPIVTGSIFAGNVSGQPHYADGGGAMWFANFGEPTVRQCTFFGNGSPTAGGITVSDGVHLILESSVVAFSTEGAAVACYTNPHQGTATLACCDIYGNAGGDWVGSIASQEGANGNLALDPRFCDGPGGNFDLCSNSPCLLTDCGQIGARGQGCVCPAPGILAITDVGNDQGRQVRIRWTRSGYDDAGDPQITGYGIYRKQGQYMKAAVNPPAQLLSTEGVLRIDGWDFIATVPARGDEIYQYVAPTLCDSTAEGGICWSSFFVSAMTSIPSLYHDSAPDSGYSVDNLAPEPPVNLAQQVYWPQVALSWDPSEEQDFDHYRVYRGDTDVFQEAEVIGEPSLPLYSDQVAGEPRALYYWVTALDFAGNESSAPALLAAGIDTSSDPMPAVMALHQNRPNPVTGQTTIAFDLTSACDVQVEIFDVAGRSISRLLDSRFQPGRHSVRWDGTDASGQPLRAGVYFCRLRVGSRTLERKLILTN